MKFRTILTVLLILVIGVPLFFALALKRVPPMTIGVKQIRWGSAGIIQQDYDTGFHLGIVGYHLWHFLPKQTHFLHFTSERNVSGGVVDWMPPQKIRTKDNNVVDIEVTIPYHIKEGEGHKLVSVGLKVEYRDRVISTVQRVLRAELSQLSSEDLQATDLRLERTKEVLPVLNRQLAEFHVEAEEILIRRFAYPQEYEDQLQEKQYLRQKANLDEALTAQANEEKTVNLIERQIVAAELALGQDWEKRLQEKRSEYEVLIAEIDARARVYAQRTEAEGAAQKLIYEAEGQLALDQADALRNQLRTEALNSRGGSILLALDAAQNLQVPAVTLNSDDPAVPMLLDLSSMTKLLVGDGQE